MSSEGTPENVLQQLNESYKLLDDIFNSLDSKNDLDEDHFKYSYDKLLEVNMYLNWISSYLKLGDESL